VGASRENDEQAAHPEVQSEQETEADLTGLQLLQRVKIDLSGMTRFFEWLSKKDEGRMQWLLRL